MRSLCFVSLVLLLAFSLASGQDHSQAKGQKDSSPQATADSEHKLPPDVVVATQQEDAASQSKRAAPPIQTGPWLTHGEWVMSVLTAIYVLLTAIYVVVASLTLKRIGHQWDEMKTSNEISRNGLEAVQRAFVFLKQTDIVGIQDPQSRKIIGFQFRMTWENSGTTPTSKLDIYVGAHMVNTELQRGSPFPILNQADRIPLVLGPKAVVVTQPFFVPVDRFQLAKAGKLHIYIFGKATYRDIFDNTPEHTSKSFSKIAIEGDPTEVSCKPVWIPHLEHNDAD